MKDQDTGCLESIGEESGHAMIHWSDLPADETGPLSQEWNHYRREVGRLLAEGQEGKWVLIKGETIVGIWDTAAVAKEVALSRFLMQPCLLHQVRSLEPVRRCSSRVWQCAAG